MRVGAPPSSKGPGNFTFQLVRMDRDQKIYMLKAESFTDWYEWTNMIEERVDTFMSEERQQHEHLIAGLLAEERRQQLVARNSNSDHARSAQAQKHTHAYKRSGLTAFSFAHSVLLDPKRMSLPPSDNFVSLCDSLVASEKDYADDLDTLLVTHLARWWLVRCLHLLR